MHKKKIICFKLNKFKIKTFSINEIYNLNLILQLSFLNICKFIISSNYILLNLCNEKILILFKISNSIYLLCLI